VSRIDIDIDIDFDFDFDFDLNSSALSVRRGWRHMPTMALRSGLAVGSAVVSLVALGASCGDEDASDEGGAGAASASAASGVSSVGPATATVVAASGTGGDSPNGVPGIVGKTCQVDEDCAPGRCIPPDVFNSTFAGAPAGGYCTFPCDLEYDCPDPGSLCLKNDQDVGECLLGCTFGEPPLLPPPEYVNQPLDPNKCHGRGDVGCLRTGSGHEVCWPACGSDSECPAGLVCDPREWACVTPESKTQGGAFGSECIKDLPPPECEGHCIGVGGVTTICSQSCPIGGEIHADSTKCAGLSRAACLTRVSGIGAGDHGWCTPTCKQQDDCRNPDFFCYDWGLPDGYGACRAREPCETDANCVWAGATCVDTIHGLFCMSAIYPLGSIAP
jgi:hypothetical protein